MEIINKQPAEIFPVSIDFTGRLPEGITVASGTVSAVDQTTLSADASVYQSGTLSTTTTTATARLKAGVDGRNYVVTYTVTLSDGSILVEDILLKVRKARA